MPRQAKKLKKFKPWIDGTRIKIEMLENSLTIKDVAKLIGTDYQTIRSVVNNNRPPSLKKILWFRQKFGISLDDLFPYQKNIIYNNEKTQ